MLSRLVSKSQSSCLCLLHTEITGIHHRSIQVKFVLFSYGVVSMKDRLKEVKETLLLPWKRHFASERHLRPQAMQKKAL
jgi:hypothetical protein